MGRRSYRLPTEAEWEFAAGSGGREEKYAGISNDAELSRSAWFKDNAQGSQPVGGKEPNGLGLYDMSGNVSEWCSDWYGGRYYAISSSINPTGPPKGKEHVILGGSWGDHPMWLRTSSRQKLNPK